MCCIRSLCLYLRRGTAWPRLKRSPAREWPAASPRTWFRVDVHTGADARVSSASVHKGQFSRGPISVASLNCVARRECVASDVNNLLRVDATREAVFTLATRGRFVDVSIKI